MLPAWSLCGPIHCKRPHVHPHTPHRAPPCAPPAPPHPTLTLTLPAASLPLLPAGSVNPHTAIVPEHPVYPVPECYTSRPPFPQGPGDLTMETVHRASFAPRTAEQTARALKSAAEQTVAARTALHKSSVPLGPAALSLLEPAQWATEKAAKYVAHPIDVAANYAQAEAFKSALGGPTASTGRLTATVWRPAAADAAATASRAEQLGG